MVNRFLLAQLASVAVLASPCKRANSDCHVLPGDAGWPTQQTWAQLNTTVGGKLVATVPIGSPCHDPTYDADACDALKAQWTNPLTQ